MPVLLLMAMYLDNASLPSPCWMITGAMARVCQDIALDKNPSPNVFSPIELECRRRLFWAVYIQERKACLKRAREGIIHDADIEISLPKALEDEDRLLLNTDNTPMNEKGPASDDDMFMSPTYTTLNAEKSIDVMIAQVHIGALCGTLLNIRISDSGGIEDLRNLQDVDSKLKQAWDHLPPHLTDLQSMDPLDLGAIRRIPPPVFFATIPANSNSAVLPPV